MSSFREDIARICMTIADFNKRIDTIESRLTALEEQLSVDRERSSMPAENEKVAEAITQLQSQLNYREQDSLLNDVGISGIQEKSGENLIHVTCLIGKKLGVELSERDIVSAERSGPRLAVSEGDSPGRPRILTIKFTRRALHDQLLRAARVRRGSDTSGIIDGSPRRFYINERLTRFNRQLFYKAREEARRKCFRYVWTSSGKLFIRRDANANAHRVRSDADIVKFFSVTVG